MTQPVEINSRITGFKVVDTKFENPKVEAVKPTIKEIKRPEMLQGTTYKLKSPLAKSAMYVTINDIVNEDGSRQPFEIFVYSKDSTHYEWITALTRMISACFRRGGDLSFILEELECIITPGVILSGEDPIMVYENEGRLKDLKEPPEKRAGNASA